MTAAFSRQGEALAAAVLQGLPAAAWLAFLQGRRWFPAGARSVRALGTARVGEDAALVLLGVEADAPWTTQVLLTVQEDMPQEAGPEGQEPPRALLRFTTPEGPRALIEASDRPEAFAALIPVLAGGEALVGEGASWSALRIGEGWTGPQSPGVRRIGGEQSNTALVLGGTALFKLFRRIEPGLHPEIEIGRFLALRGFPYSPALLTALAVEGPGGRAAAGALHAFLPGRVDGWTHALARCAEELADDDGTTLFAAQARSLGAATRALHETLASDPGDPAFAPRPALDEDRARWVASLRATAGQALTQLAARKDGLPESARALAETALAQGTSGLAPAEAALLSGSGTQIRIHGDYHLGQVLFDPSHGTWSLLDFEGEPSRPLAERALPQLPLRDVAGMLRSFAYAAAAAGGGTPGRAAAWERAVADAFVAGYDAAAAPDSQLPQAHGSPLLRACVVERAFYELLYELEYRPHNAWIPLQAIAALV